MQAVSQVARTHLGRDAPLEPAMRLIEDLELDSIALLTLAVEVENRFEICLEPEDEAGIATVADLTDAVARKLASG